MDVSNIKYLDMKTRLQNYIQSTLYLDDDKTCTDCSNTLRTFTVVPSIHDELPLQYQDTFAYEFDDTGIEITATCKELNDNKVTYLFTTNQP